MRLIILELVSILVFFIILPVVLFTDYSFVSHSAPITQLYSLDSDHPLIFQITNPQSLPLNSLSLNFKNPNIQNTSTIEVTLSSPTGQTYQSLSFSGANVGDPSRVDLQIRPLPQPLIFVSITTNNTVKESLFVATDPNFYPLFSTTYRPPNFTSRLKLVMSAHFLKFSTLPFSYTALYFFVILSLHYVLFKKT